MKLNTDIKLSSREQVLQSTRNYAAVSNVQATAILSDLTWDLWEAAGRTVGKFCVDVGSRSSRDVARRTPNPSCVHLIFLAQHNLDMLYICW